MLSRDATTLSSEGFLKYAVIIGASSGIGEALARQLVRDGWHVAAAARRVDRLQALAAELGEALIPMPLDVQETQAAQDSLERFWQQCGRVDLVILSAGTGHLNPRLDWQPERETLDVNVLGFAALATTAMRLFMRQGYGHLAGISSVARFRGNGAAPAYSASKAFVSVYLDGLRDAAKQAKLPIYVTELCPGFVKTAMMRAEKTFWVATPEKAARQMLRAIKQHEPYACITRRWTLVAWFLRLLPRP